VIRAIASSLLSLLVVTTLLWGGCVSCEQYFMWSGAKSCCSPDGHCKTKSPDGKKERVDCKQIAFEHQRAIDASLDMPVANAVLLEAPVQQGYLAEPGALAGPIDPSPPDLQVLHSTFLI
jgi:hypothetical protein